MTGKKKQIVIRNPTYLGFGDPYGHRDPMHYILEREHDRELVAKMFHPVKCTHCGAIYDGGCVEVIARYADCSVWISPCCKLQVDDRDRFWKSRPDMKVIHGPDAVTIVAYTSRARRLISENVPQAGQPEWPRRVTVLRENEKWFLVSRKIWNSSLRIKIDATNSPIGLAMKGRL